MYSLISKGKIEDIYISWWGGEGGRGGCTETGGCCLIPFGARRNIAEGSVSLHETPE